MFLYQVKPFLHRARMEKKKPREHVLLEFIRREGIIRVRDLKEHGFHPETLRRLHREGHVIRVSRGMYKHPDTAPTEHQTLIEVFKRVPHGVACLLTALQFHEIGTQNPRDVWIALKQGARKPKMEYPRIRVVRFSGPAMTEGIEHRKLSGVTVRVYNVAKTVADCFRFRNKIGLDVAVEALSDSLRSGRCSADDIWRYAKIRRVTNVIQPYLTAITSRP